MSRLTADSSTRGRAPPNCNRICIDKISTSFRQRTKTIALASGVLGLSPARAKSPRDDKMGWEPR